MGFSGSSVSRPPALIRDQVAAQIRDAITDLRLAPGTVLVEGDLCKSTTASRSTVREALRQLESEGLVTSNNGRGTVVASLSREEARQVYEVRSSLEGTAGRLFALYATDAERRALRAALLEVEESLEDATKFILTKRKFYSVLVDGTRNTELKRVWEAINLRSTLTRVASLSKPGRMKDSIKEIEAICDAAVEGNADLAERLCRQHIDNASAVALEQLSKQFKN